MLQNPLYGVAIHLSRAKIKVVTQDNVDRLGVITTSLRETIYVMEEEKMIWNILFLAVGVMVLVTGLYYFAKAGNNAESKKIYGIFAGAGGAIAVISLVWLLFTL